MLSGEGIGSAEFGAEPDAVISYITSLLGEPTNDTGWIDPLSVGACPGTEIRFVDWGTLSLVFGDASQVDAGPPALLRLLLRLGRRGRGRTGRPRHRRRHHDAGRG